MQKKTNGSSQGSITDMHFAVVPYEVQYLVPNDEIYDIYFQKGLQILGSTKYPIQNLDKAKNIEIPIINNVITFRLFSERNSQYQWSIYKRINEMQEFIESKKINLKEILKKEPLKRVSTQKKNRTQRKQSMNTRRSKIQLNDLKAVAAKASQLKALDSKANEFKTMDFNVNDKLSEVSVQGKGCIYDQQVKCEQGQFILKFYLFRAFSSQQLSKTIQEKCREKKQSRVPLTQINVNKMSQLPQINESSSPIQEESRKEIPLREQIQPEQKQEEKLEKKQQAKLQKVEEQAYPVLQPQGQQKNTPQGQKEEGKGRLQTPVKLQKDQQQIFTNEEQTSRKGYIQLNEQKEETQQIVPQIQSLTPTQAVTQQANVYPSIKDVLQSPIHKGKLEREDQDVTEQAKVEVQQLSNERPESVEAPLSLQKPSTSFSLGKKMFILTLLLMVVLYVVYSMNLLDKYIYSAQNVKKASALPKKQKKQKFSNRKKSSK